MKNSVIRKIVGLLLLVAISTSVYGRRVVNGFNQDKVNYYVVGLGKVEVIQPFGLLYGKNVVIPSSVTHDGKTYEVVGIGDNAFNSQWVESIVIPPSVKYIGFAAFLHSELRSIHFPTNIDTVPHHCFYDCQYLTNVRLYDNVKHIGSSAFYYCVNLPWIDIPGNVDVVDTLAFAECTRLEHVYLHEGTRVIAHNAFFHCRSLAEIELPSTIEFIGQGAFAECEKLQKVKIHAQLPPMLNAGKKVERVFNKISKTAVLYVPKGSLQAYRSAPQWMDFTEIVEFEEEK